MFITTAVLFALCYDKSFLRIIIFNYKHLELAATQHILSITLPPGCESQAG